MVTVLVAYSVTLLSRRHITIRQTDSLPNYVASNLYLCLFVAVPNFECFLYMTCTDVRKFWYLSSHDGICCRVMDLVWGRDVYGVVANVRRASCMDLNNV